MARDQASLFGRKRPPGVRAREAAAVRRHLHELDAADPLTEALCGALIELARQLDELRVDPDASAHNVATVARVYADTLDRLRPSLGSSDNLDALLADLLADDPEPATPVRHTPST